ncbi:MAG: spermine/spermidine synthase domain-containing protein [Polyangiales bacterium]
MRAWEIIDNAATRDGDDLILSRTGDKWEVHTGYRMLMSSGQHASEEALAQLAFSRSHGVRRVLLGGLGLGFTLRATLDLLPPDGQVVVAETSEALVRWNRTHVAHLAASPLDDPRVQLKMGDVGDRIAEASGSYDVVLLDVDNGPTALVHSTNDRLYDDDGVRACLTALRPNGVLAVWAAFPDDGYLRRLHDAGFDAEDFIVEAGGTDGDRHVVYVGAKRT